MKQIFVVKPGTLSAKDKEKLTKNNHIVIEHPFPGDVRIITDTSEIKGDDLIMSFVDALQAYDSSAVNPITSFGRHFIKRIKNKGSEKIS